MSLERRQKEFEQFCAERQWLLHHSPKNLTMALAGEVGELVALFQWTDGERSIAIMGDPQLAERVREELADITLYLLRLAHARSRPRQRSRGQTSSECNPISGAGLRRALNAGGL